MRLLPSVLLLIASACGAGAADSVAPAVPAGTPAPAPADHVIPWLSDAKPWMLPPAPKPGGAAGPAEVADYGGELPSTAPPSNWTRKGVIGVYVNSTTTANGDLSRDQTIAGTTSSTALSGKIDAGAEWRSGPDSVEHLLYAEYGRIHQRGQDWVDNKDDIRYDGVYRRNLTRPSFLYVSWGLETVLLGPPPTEDAFQPFLIKGAVGYGQLFENMLPEKDRFEWRVGARVQKRWGRYVPDDQDGIETGPEFFARYERQAIIKRDGQDLRYFAQYEAFSEFNDMRHVTNLFTAGLTYQFTRFLTLDLALRAYYETWPKDERDDHQGVGFDQWSLRQDTMLGLAYTF